MLFIPVEQTHMWRAVRLTAILSLLALLAACAALESGQPGFGSNRAWQSADIGGREVAGETRVFSPSKIQVLAAGEDIWDEADAFRFVYQSLHGDQALVVRVDEIDAVDEWTKVGLMIRENLDVGARNAMVLLTNDNGALFQRRDVAGGATNDVLPDGTYMRDHAVRAPSWLKIERKGSQIIGWHSNNGADWKELGRVTLNLPQEVLIGMAVSSVRAHSVASGTYSSIRLESDTNAGLAPSPGPSSETTYQVDRVTDLLNPERGFHGYANLLGSGSMSGIREDGMTLARSYVRLDDYRNRPIPEPVLSSLRNGFQRAREAGIKVIPRFTYNFGADPDAPLDIVLIHIGQLKPILTEYADVIAVLQAGFIGAWGEWHHSTNNLTSGEAKESITTALLDALPESRMIQIRTPSLIRSVAGSPSPSTAPFSAQRQARIGFVNDCFLSSKSDVGTYSGDQVQDRAEAEALSRYAATGGETCDAGEPSRRNECPTALAELAQFHWDYINSTYYKGILDIWRNQGCFDEIWHRMGYRLALIKGSATKAILPGDTLTVNLRMENSGFGKVYNPRPAEVILRSTSTGHEYTLRAADDIRTLLPLGGETKDIQLNVAVPSAVANGEYRLFLRLPDASPNLENDVRYAIRLANVGTWQASTGRNDLGLITNVGTH